MKKDNLGRNILILLVLVSVFFLITSQKKEVDTGVNINFYDGSGNLIESVVGYGQNEIMLFSAIQSGSNVNMPAGAESLSLTITVTNDSDEPLNFDFRGIKINALLKGQDKQFTLEPGEGYIIETGIVSLVN